MAAPAETPSEGAPEWMVSYADMITIMMAFFVVLYATTSSSGTKDKGGKAGEEARGGKEATYGTEWIKNPALQGETAQRLQKILDSLYYRFGPEWTIKNCWTGGPPPLRKGGTGLGTGDERGIGRPGIGPGRGEHTVPLGPKANENIVGSPVFFRQDDATLSDDQKKQLHGLVEILAGKTQKIEICGHTDHHPLPSHSPYRDHWDLAYARCRAVNEDLLNEGIDPRRIRLAVAGENEAVGAPDDPLRVRNNSRVEVRLLNQWVSDPSSVPARVRKRPLARASLPPATPSGSSQIPAKH